MRATVITAIYDGFDELKPPLPQVGADVDWVFVTDDERYVNGDADPLGWGVVYRPMPGVHPCRAAKHPKMFPSEYTDAPHSVWIDGSFRVISSTFVVDVLQHARRWTSGFAQFRHPWRNCLYQEATASMELGKYADEIQHIKPQVDAYQRFGMPESWGLWATGVIARYAEDNCYQWSRIWHDWITAYSYQDQISQPFALWQERVQPTALPGSHMHNQWVRYEGSARHG